jgi:hypothetical protein
VVQRIEEEPLVADLANQQLIGQTAVRVEEAGGPETQFIAAVCLP